MFRSNASFSKKPGLEYSKRSRHDVFDKSRTSECVCKNHRNWKVKSLPIPMRSGRDDALATKTGGANGEAVGGTRLRGMRHTDSHFCFGHRSRRCSPLRVAR
jgi:hypothetical protein